MHEWAWQKRMDYSVSVRWCPCIRAVMQLLRPILAAIMAESYTTVDKSHQLSSYPHGWHVGIGFEMLVLGLRHWRGTRITSQVRIPVFDVLTLGLTCWHWVRVWTCWHCGQGQKIWDPGSPAVWRSAGQLGQLGIFPTHGSLTSTPTCKVAGHSHPLRTPAHDGSNVSEYSVRHLPKKSAALWAILINRVVIILSSLIPSLLPSFSQPLSL